jgi:hypothetical protein
MSLKEILAKKELEGVIIKEMRKEKGQIRIRKSLRNIGIRNPYALADRISKGETKNWGDRSPEINRNLLDITLKIPYEQLFDPAYGSPLFGAKTLDVFGFKKEKTELKMDLGSGAGKGLSVGAPEISVAVCEKGSLLWATINNGMWIVDTGTTPVPTFDDPVQGPVLDCYYLAVLGSFAWHTRINGRYNLAISFFDTKNGTHAYGTTGKISATFRQINQQLPLTSDGVPGCAHSKDTNETWVPFYEKAYTCYLEDIKAISPASKTPNQPLICRIPEGDPCNIMNLMTGKKPEYRSTASFSTEKDLLKDFVESTLDISIITPSLRTRYPTVAYTYCSGDPAALKELGLEVRDSACAAPTGSGVLYQDDIIPANHAFSLLGTHTDDSGDFIILRNPYGPDCGTCATKIMYSLAQSELDFGSSKRYALKSDNHIPGVNNGVFALNVKDFLSFFQGYCWIPI